MAILSYKKADGTVVKLNSYKVNNLVPQQTKGNDPNLVMSQKAVTDELGGLCLRIDEVTGQITAINTNLGTKANVNDVYTKAEADGKYLTAADITGKADKSEVSAVDAKADKNASDIADINTDITEINNTLGDMATVDALGELENVVSLKANKSEVYTTTQADGKFQSKGAYLTAADITGKADKSEVEAVDAKVDDNTARIEAIENETTIDCGEY